MILFTGLLAAVGWSVVAGAHLRFLPGFLLHGSEARKAGFILMLPAGVSVFFVLFAALFSRPYTGGMVALELLALFVAMIIVAYRTLTTQAAQEREQKTADAQQAKISYQLPDTSVITPQEAAKFLRVTTKDILVLIQDGSLPAVWAGSKYRIDREAFLEYVRRAPPPKRKINPALLLNDDGELAEEDDENVFPADSIRP